jgi:predicted transcriptional regulator/Ni/Co efflux regulator RcnB
MRTMTKILVALLALTMLATPAAASHEAASEEAKQVVDEALGKLPVDSPLEPQKQGDSDAANPSSSSNSAFIGGVVSAITVVTQAAVAAGKGILGIGLGLVSGVFGVFATGGETAKDAVDAVAANPSSSGATATLMALALGGTLGLLALIQRYGSLAAIPLFSRIAKSDLLENKVRAEIFELIKANPGINVSEVSRRLDIAWGTATHHLQKLRAEKLVAIRSVANQKCYFVNGGTYTPGEMDLMSATKNPTAKRIAEFLVTSGPQCHQDISNTLGISPALVSFHMRKLLDAGVVARERRGRNTMFSPLATVLEPVARVPSH